MGNHVVMSGLYEQIQETTAVIRQRWPGQPKTGIILGTGLGGLEADLDKECILSYRDLPHFPLATVESHAGHLICGNLGGKPVVAMAGRFHQYEGYSLQQVTFPVRVMKALGVEQLIVSNVSGGMNPQYEKGDLMLIEDHVNLLGDNPLIGPNDERLGPRFPDMCDAYDRELLKLAEHLCRQERIAFQKGVYVAVTGPNLETRAEYRFLRNLGADVVGMSTVPEVIVCRHAGIRVLGISIVTDLCLPDALVPISLPEILATAKTAEEKLRILVRKVVEALV
jgi:purine-nucleoside phosphorylase